LPKKKLQRYGELAAFDNVIQPSYDEFKNDYSLKGNWASSFFGNDNPIVLELGCGKGDYSIGLGENFSGINFIGIDRKGDRLWKGSVVAKKKGLDNVAFLRTGIEYLDHFFGREEVSEIWLTFPDPQPKNRQVKKRLTNPSLLSLYGSVLQRNGVIHLKTDNLELFEYTIKVINEEGHCLLQSTTDLFGDQNNDEVLSIRTYYEQKFLDEGITIKYLKFNLRA